MKDKLVKEIKRNKFKILAFMIGYLLVILDYKMLEAIKILFSVTDMFYLITFNFIFIMISAFSIKKIVMIYKNIVIIKSDKKYIKTFKYMKIISLGALVGFISMILQAFIIVVFPY